MQQSALGDMSPTNTISCMSTITFGDSSSSVVFNMSNFEGSTHSQLIYENDFDEFSVTDKDIKNNTNTDLQCKFDGTAKENLSDKNNLIDYTSEKDVSKGNGSLYSRLMREFITDEVRHDSVEIEQKPKEYYINANSTKKSNCNRNDQMNLVSRNDQNQNKERDETDVLYPRINETSRVSDILNNVPKENFRSVDKGLNLSLKEKLQDQPDTKSMDMNETKMGNTFDSSKNDIILEKKDLSRQWRKVEDDVTGKVYYYNRKTRKSQWTTPEDAIILPRKRRHFPTFTTSKSITSGTCSSIISSIHPTVDFEDSIQSNSVYSIDNHMIKYDSSIEIDEGVSEDTSRQSLQYRDIVSPSPKESSENHSNDDTSESSVNTDLDQSLCTNNVDPQKIQEKTTPEIIAILPTLYCLYCGESFNPPAQLIMHLANCENYAMVRKSNPGIVEFIKNSFVFPLKKETKSLKNCNLDLSALKKEKNDVLNSSDARNFCLGQKSKTDIDCRKGSDNTELRHTPKKAWELTLNHQDFSNTSHYSPQLHYESSPGIYSEVDRDDDEYESSPICSKCPFCKRSFRKGNQLSSHLLKCQERKRARKRMKSGNSHTQHTIQSLLTGGGRHLPGYPKLSNKTYSK